MEWLARFSSTSASARVYRLIVGLLGVLLVGVVDYLTGYELGVSIFYLGPILFVAWVLGRNSGFAVSLVAAVVWLAADLLAGHSYSHLAIAYWNAGVRLGFFLIAVYLLSKLREGLDREKEWARSDFLTGTFNSRAFDLAANGELARSRRSGRPISVAYIDLDNLKVVNDTLGHGAGDEVLRVMGKVLKEGVREVDVVGRLGGDEFALLLPETAPGAAEVVLERVRRILAEVMKANGWSVTFSVGIATFLSPPDSTDELIKRADDLMYSAKKAGKNTMRTQTFDS
jgi:diguanylate cyclase (GGDEF)-like protein